MASKISSAEQFFSDIMSAGDKGAFILALVADPPITFETVWLDFKEGAMTCPQ